MGTSAEAPATFTAPRGTRGAPPRSDSGEDLLGNSGVGLAGDAFDARIIRKLVSPALGSDSEARSLNKLLPAVPAWIYANLERWHYLSFLRTNNVREILKSARIRALEPEKIEALIAIVDEDLGYQLHQSVQELKFELSREQDAEFRFHGGGMDLRIPVTRARFESWIKDELEAIEGAVDALLQSSGVDPRAVDRVFLTGGSSFVPASCGGVSRAALVRRGFAAGMSLRRLLMGWRCAQLNRFAGGLRLQQNSLDVKAESVY